MLKKTYLKSRPVVKVDFLLNADQLPKDAAVDLLCEADDWQPQPMARLKSRPFYKITREYPLSAGQQVEIAFRYRIAHADGQIEYENDWAADKYRPSSADPASDNSICVLSAPVK